MKKLENQKEKIMQEICKKYGEVIPGYPNYRITRDAKVYSNRSGNWVTKKRVSQKIRGV